MDLEKLDKIANKLTICLKITLVLALVITFFLSFILKNYFTRYFIYDKTYYYATVVFITISGISSSNILLQLIKIMETISCSNPFVNKNAVCLKRIAYSSLAISACFFALLFFRATMLTFMISYVFLIAFFSCLVFSGLFQKAVDYKDENDLTI